MHGGTVGDGRGRSGSGRVAVGGRAARLPGLPGGRCAPWGWARPRGVHGIGEALRPRRARCAGCLVTHVLLPVTVLLRRAYAAEVIGAAVAGSGGRGGSPPDRAAAGGAGGDGAGLAAGDGRAAGAGAGALLQVARRAGVDLAVPKALGLPWRDVLAAVGAATAAVTGRFGPVGVLGPVTAWQVAVGVLSGGRLLSPGWPAPVAGCRPTRVAPDARGWLVGILARVIARPVPCRAVLLTESRFSATW